MAEYHKMKAWLYDNPLTPDPYDFFIRIKSEKALTVDDVSQSAAKRGGSNVTPQVMTNIVTLWLQEFAYRACDGFAINTGWFTVQPTVKGAANSPNEKFNPEKHSIAFDFKQGALMRKELKGVEVEILGVASAGLSITEVTDVRTGSVNDLITPGRNLKITGTRLKIIGDHPENGVFFINVDTHVRTKVDERDFTINNPSELAALIPDLPEGAYQLEVCTQFSSGNNNQLLKEPRKTTFYRILTVEG